MNTGIGSGDSVHIQENLLDLTPGGQDIQDIGMLEARGAAVTYAPQDTIVSFADPSLEAAVRAS